MGVLITLAFLLLCGIAVYPLWQSSQRNELVKQGKAAYFVKVAASGKGGVYHSMSCRKCIAWQEMTLEEARRRGYPPCATCGGRGAFRVIDNTPSDVRNKPIGVFHSEDQSVRIESIDNSPSEARNKPIGVFHSQDQGVQIGSITNSPSSETGQPQEAREELMERLEISFDKEKDRYLCDGGEFQSLSDAISHANRQ